MTNEKLMQVINKSADYIANTKPQYMNLHSYFVAIGISRREYLSMLKVNEQHESYKNITMAIDIIEHAKDIIISNILTTQVLNPYAKNGQVAMQYLKIISKEFKDDNNESTDKLNIVIKSGNGPISIKGGKK